MVSQSFLCSVTLISASTLIEAMAVLKPLRAIYIHLDSDTSQCFQIVKPFPVLAAVLKVVGIGVSVVSRCSSNTVQTTVKMVDVRLNTQLGCMQAAAD